MTRRHFSFGLVCSVLLLHAAAPARATEPADGVVLQLAFTPQFQFAGYYAAAAQGYFQREGLTVELRHGGGGIRSVPEVLAGRAQYGIGTTTALLARLKGEPLVALAAIFQHSPFALATKPGAGFSTLTSLAGKRIALDSKERFPEVYAMLTAEGMSADKFQIVPDLPNVNELEAGQAEAMISFTTDSPYSMAQRGMPIHLIRPVDYGVDFYGDLLFTTEAEINMHPERVAAMRRAIVAGWQYAVDHPEEMIRWILENEKDRPVRITDGLLHFEATETLKLINADLVAIGHMNPGRWRTIANLYVKAGLVPNAARLEGFLYDGTSLAPRWGRWLVAGLTVTVGLTLLGLLANWRLKKLVRARTRALEQSDVLLREQFDQAPVAIVVEDYTEVAARLENLRAAGTVDCRGLFRERPELIRELFRAKRMVDANATALRRTGFQSIAEMDRRLPEIMTKQGMEMFVEELVALWDGRDALTLERTYNLRGGETAHALVNWLVGRRDGQRDLSRVRLVFTDITELKLAESALSLSEARYRQLFELSPVATVEFDYHGIGQWFRELRAAGVTDLAAHFAAHPELAVLVLKYSPLLQVNQAAVRLIGARSKEELMSRLAEILTPDAITQRCRIVARLWDGLDQSEGEIQLRALDGQRRDFFYSTRLPREAGELSFGRSQTALVDITEQRQTARSLRESEERYRSLFETTPNPMYIVDLASLRFIEVNAAAVRHYGYTREEFLAMSIMNIRPPDEAERLRAGLANYSAGTVTAAGIWRHRRKDGSIIYVEVSSRNLQIGGRNCMLVVPFDITERTKTDEALRASEVRYRELFEKATSGIYRSSPEGRFLIANPALARILGYDSVEDLISEDTRNNGAPLYVDAGRRAELQAAIISGSGHVENFESEVRCQDGSTAWISENVRQVRDAAGRVLYHEGFVSDITPRRRLEGEMLRASKLEAVGILAGGIAHDFNNILTVVLGNITLAEMDSGAQIAVVKLLRDAKRATLRARDLTQQLLTFAKGGDPVRSAVNLPELLSESAGFALHGAKASSEFAFAPELWSANADKGQIGQVVQNLVINSVQAMPEGGVVRIGAVNVAVPPGKAPMALPPGRYVKISVGDTGVGIAPEHVAKIFDPYFTTKQQGSGLGLATVYSVIKKHQGQVEVESRLGVGTTFHLWLPAAPGTEAAATDKTAAPLRLKARVLFMDDEPAIRNMAGMFLGRLGIDFELAADGAAAVTRYKAAAAARQPFDLVIMDLTVPGGMGGREAMEQLRAFDLNVKAIVSSGYSQDPVLASYQSHGFRGILPKPYSLDQLQEVLRDVVIT